MKSFSNPIVQVIGTFSKISSIVFKDRPWLLIGQYGTLPLTAAVPFAVAGITGLLVDKLTLLADTGITTNTIILLIVAMVAIQAGNILIDYQTYLLYTFRYYFEEKFAVLGMKKRGSLDTELLENPEINDLYLRYEEKGLARTWAFMDRFPMYVQSFFEVLIGISLFIFNIWWIIPIAIIATIPRIFVELKYGRNIFSLHDAQSETRRRADEIKSHFKTTTKIAEMRLFQTITYWTSAFHNTFKGFKKEREQAERKRLLIAMAANIFSYALNGVVIFVFVFEVIHGQLSVGAFIFFSTSLVKIQSSLDSFFRWSGRIYTDSLFATDVLNFLDIKNTMPHAKNGIVLKNEAPSIEFQNVSFKYPDAEKNVITDFSLLIPAGSKVALVGLNGAGKTTLVKLLCRFYDPTAGSILIDGHDLREVDIESWYAILGVLFQDYDQYRLQTKDAIAIGRSDIPQDFAHIRAAAHEGEADTFIEKWSKQYEQNLGVEFENGVEPSIGQWQKLALARTFYRNPRVLILDEPTSSIDAEAEANIFDQIRSTEKNRTLMLISHRFSTVRHTDQIVVMEHGKILEKGTHNELMKEKGKYSELFKLQAEGYQ